MGCCEVSFDIDEYVAMYATDLPSYGGSVDITPSNAAQTIPTANTALTDDITVQAVPYAEVQNAYGTTVLIGGAN